MSGSRSNMADIAEVWRRGSVVSSWLLDLTALALAENETLSNFQGGVADSGEGRWTIEAAIEEAVPAPVLSAALYARFRSRREHTFADKLLSAMRSKFGGHAEAKIEGRLDRWTSTCRCRIDSLGPRAWRSRPKRRPARWSSSARAI